MTPSKEERPVASIERKTLSRQVLDRFVQLLSSGQWKPGDKLPSEMELSGMLDVSRPVLREAMSSLETLGVISRKTRSGTYLNEKIGNQPFSVMLALSTENLQAIIEARMALELGLVTIAAEKITDEQLEQLESTIDAIAKSTDNNYGEIDKQFHRLIAMSAQNPVVEGLIDSLLIAHDKMDSRIKIRERELTVEYHTRIYRALANRDPHESFRQMYEHLNYVRRKLLQQDS